MILQILLQVYCRLYWVCFCVQVLEYFHQQKKQRGVDEALLRLYEPIMWRAFKVGNGHGPSVFVHKFVNCQGMDYSTLNNVFFRTL